MVPEMISLAASETLKIGIHAVVVVNSIPGRKETIAGIATTIIMGLAMLCASLKLCEKTEMLNITAANEMVLSLIHI